jgi:mono/diheme cytochrome c family protein
MFRCPAYGLVLCILTAFAIVSARPATAAITAEQRQEVGAVGSLVAKAGTAYTAKKFEDAAAAIKEAQSRLEKLAGTGDPQVLTQLEPIYKRIKGAHALLELEGITLPALKALDEMKGTPAPKPAPNAGPAAPVPGTVSFVSHVAPILIAKCGKCHVTDTKGMFSLISYEAYTKSAAAPLLIDKIENGDMPRGGLKVTAEELVVLKKWFDAGSKFDGNDPKANLATLAPGAKPAEAPKVEVMAATGKETVSFSRDIAPVLVKSCTGCHGTERPRENFSVSTFARLIAGGDGGPVIAPGKPDDSLLIKKLEGKGGGERMPMNQPALATDVIAKFRKWIEEGGKFDGTDQKLDIARIAALAKAAGSTHQQLSADRAKQAEEQWRLVMPGIKADQTETDNFLVLGNIGENTLIEIGKAAEAIAPKVGDIFKHPAGTPLVKGRMTLFVFRQRYDYSEFGKMVEQRDIPSESRGHWRYGGVEAYGALVNPQSGDYGMNALVAHQLGGTYIASLGKGTPRWFGEGAGRAAAARIDAKDGRVQRWDAELPRVLSEMKSSDEFIGGKMPGEDGDIASYSFVKFLMQDSRKFNLLVDGLRKGGDFTQLFSQNYGGSPSQLTDGWVKRAASTVKKK